MERRSIKKAEAISLLQKRLDTIPQLWHLHDSSPEFEKWRGDIRVDISNIFEEGEKSTWLTEFHRISFSSPTMRARDESRTSPRDYSIYSKGLQSAKTMLETMIREIEEHRQDEEEPANESATQPINTKKVFIVHGRNEEYKEKVARFLEKFSLEPIILHEKASEGRTIIEKFEKHSQQVGFAIVLLTADDVGAPKEAQANLKPRARQNAILELGYFIGKLGRKRVCTLLEPSIEKPSDYDGVVYVELDNSDSWQSNLIREMKAAGLRVDANRAF